MLIQGHFFDHERYRISAGLNIIDQFSNVNNGVVFPDSDLNYVSRDIGETLTDWVSRNQRHRHYHVNSLNYEYWWYMLELFKYLDTSKTREERDYNRTFLPDYTTNNRIVTYKRHKFKHRSIKR